MRSRAVHEALRAFAREFGRLLTRALDEGAELPFEVLEEGDRGSGRAGPTGRPPVLYRYRPLTGVLIDERWEAARELDAYAPAHAAIAPAANAYARHRGLTGSGPDAALRDLLERLYHEATSFDLPEDRLGRILAELDAMLERESARATVMAQLHGVRIASMRVELGDGLALARRVAVETPPVALEGAARSAESTAQADEGDLSPAEGNPLDVLCLLERELPPDAPLPVEEARTRFRRLLAALRLCGAGGTALGPLAWARADAGAWHPVALGVSASGRPESWELRASDESELRELLEVLELSRHGAPVAWALDRFEMGCERGLETEALSDHLLGLRALLGEPGSDAETVARRVAALCAPEPDRPAVRERVAAAFALERRLIRDGLDHGGAVSRGSPRALVREVEQHLRALLRDVICGYLDEDLRALADGAETVSGDSEGRSSAETGLVAVSG